MLEKVDLSRSLSREQYKAVIPELTIRLGEAQRRVKEAGIPVVIVFEGWAAAGKGTQINRLILPLDPRGIRVHAMQAPRGDETLYPYMKRFWDRLPSRGWITIFDRSWYRRVLEDRATGATRPEEARAWLGRFRSFEQQLAEDGAVLIKFFLHLSRKEQGKRLRKLESQPATAWRVTRDDWRQHKHYADYIPSIDEMIAETDTGWAPWKVIESNNRRFASAKIYQSVLESLETALDAREQAARAVASGKARRASKKAATIPGLPSLNSSILDQSDLTAAMDLGTYRRELKACQSRLRELEHEIYQRRVPVVVAYEGWDAAGKGGNIRRLVENLDPRGYEVIPVAAPNDWEKSHHYLWRFWNRFPKDGHIAIFDRTWYGRVLVERVEGFAGDAEWKRAYREINEMEEQWAAHGAALVKFWIHIDPDTQLQRFKDREATPHKEWKITAEDWRNREKWDAYKAAVDEMLFRTSTAAAPWTIIEANDKYHARIKALKTVISAMESRVRS